MRFDLPLKKPKNEATKIRKGRLAKRKSAASNLSLMDDSELELQIAVGRLSKTINESQPIELEHLCLRVEKIINRSIEGKQNPLGPVALGQALSQGLLLMEDIKPSLRVFVDYFEAELEPVLTALYKECNEYLIGRRVLPDLDEDDVNERFFEEDEEVKKVNR